MDWKNYPGYDDVLDPKSSFYVGKYANQLGCYRDALVKAGKRVLDILVCYPVQGRCVKVVSEK